MGRHCHGLDKCRQAQEAVHMATLESTIAFIGVGTMGEALLAGSLNGGLDPAEVIVMARHPDRVADLEKTYGVRGTTNLSGAVADAGVVILCVPPIHVLEIVDDLHEQIPGDALLVSLADGVTLDDLANHAPSSLGIARAMPSLTARVGQGLTLLTTRSCSEGQEAAVTRLFERSGNVLHVDEEQQAKLAPLSSGGAAHLLYVVEAMVEAGALRGVPRDHTRQVMTQAVAGTAALLRETEAEPRALRDEFCAPAGAGARRMASLDRRGVRSAFLDALSD
jgi:pyrroline-5-carboxylate reductase